jgi:hypothetical protein
MLKIDLEAAGIPYETDSGVADFHSLRGCYISYLISSGASIKTTQTLARHSTPSLTIGIYAKASRFDIDGAVEALPDLAPKQQLETEVLSATGTDGATRIAHPSQEHEADESTQLQCLQLDSIHRGDRRSHDLQSDHRMGTRNRPHTFGSAGTRRQASSAIVSEFNSGSASRREAPESAQERSSTATYCAPADPDFELIRNAWDGLPEAVRRQIVSIVRDSTPG